MRVLIFLLAVIAGLLLSPGTIEAQSHGFSFFSSMKPISPPASGHVSNKPGLKLTTVTAFDSTFFAVRPVVSIAAIEIPSRRELTGAGASIQNLTYNYATQKYYCNYSLSFLAFAGTTFDPTKPTDVLSYGAMVGVLNNTVNAGITFNGGKPNFVFGVNINFNNGL